ncbi:DUF4244 domain-containing protein [Plantibacter sp. ME-Dv--P-095]|uniref:DUF4244 domain-containing protein n=1 Tax=Plantibacter sp. ME-Dv--P-095 TaxID=3040299 RepID=UPI002550B992|nr:DUF4244 domain-containing protein [Plantibacter sp. ME-Dv--P-095]
MIRIGSRIEQDLVCEARRLLRDERGSATAEYAVATMATVARFGVFWGHDFDPSCSRPRCHLRPAVGS